MMLESVLADYLHQRLQVFDVRHTVSAECVQRVVGHLAFAHVRLNDAFLVVGGYSCECERTGRHASDARAERTLFAHRACNDLLVIHLDVAEYGLRQVAAVEQHAFVGIVAVVVIPVEQGSGFLRSKRERVHRDSAGNVDLAGARHQLLAHHAHYGAGNHTVVFLD